MSADFSQYVDLTIYDKEPGDMYLEAIELARLTLPEFNLRAGTVEDAIFQAITWVGWVNATAINRIPDRLMAGILSMMGVTIRLALPAQMGVQVTADSYEGATIPAGTLFGYNSTFEDEVIEYVFITVEPLEIDSIEDPEPGDPYPSGTVNAECLTPGVIPTIQPGTNLTILSPSTSIISAQAANDFQNGVNEETSASFLSRATSYLNSLSATIVKASQVDAYVANLYSGLIGRVKTYDLTNGDSTFGDIAIPKSSEITGSARIDGENIKIYLEMPHQFAEGDEVVITGMSDENFNGTYTLVNADVDFVEYANPGPLFMGVTENGLIQKGIEATGHITTFVYGKGDFLTTQQLTDIKNAISEKTVPGIIVDVKNMQILELSIEVSLVLDANYDIEPLVATVENTLIQYLSPEGYPLAEDAIIENQIIALISKIPGVTYVSSFAITPVGNGWLPQIGSVLEPSKKGWSPRVTPQDIQINYTVV